MFSWQAPPCSIGIRRGSQSGVHVVYEGSGIAVKYELPGDLATDIVGDIQATTEPLATYFDTMVANMDDIVFYKIGTSRNSYSFAGRKRSCLYLYL